MDSFPSAQFTSSQNFTYNYIHIPPSQGGTYVLFLHGFPSSSHDWRFQISYFSKKGYGILAPDCLGYGGTSKPLDLQAYKGKAMADDIFEILKHENIFRAIGVGHDWGSFLLSRLANFYPSLFTKLCFIDVGYSPPQHGLTRSTVKHINDAVKNGLGYGVFGYFLFFEEEDAAKLMDENWESVESLFFSTDVELGKKYLGDQTATRQWFNGGNIAPSPAFVSPEDKARFQKLFSPEEGGFAPGLNWYVAQLNDINKEDEAALPESSHALHQPTLLIASTNFVTVAADFSTQMKPFVPDFVTEVLDCGHWVMLEKPDETNKILEDFFA